ncbi:sodium-dependent transporter [Halorarum halophilum]|uniref:Sodium-dependent transporter n=1 Tax=Halorarum halophilum TaxID=2743090 RepID=A0A7D5GJC0_9EURY|nr:sodium-dependent transporter [Halobaculum halophilum]QLG28771.1 sodium-dependent transporter [Halobaculum halophilum]
MQGERSAGDEQWSSRTGFVLAAVGAAVGLGNVWRFSAVAGTNGGGAYVLPYLVAAFVLAAPLLVLEFAVGRAYRTDVVGAFRAVRPWLAPAGWAAVGAVFVLLSYYLVLTGWVLAFALAALLGREFTFVAFTAGWAPVGYFLAAAAVVAVVVSLGVRDGIERLSKLAIPIVFLVLVGLGAFAFTLPGAREGLTFLFAPRTDALADPGVWVAALGQVFFSLSVGQGVMLTYGAYLPDEVDLRRSAVVITVADVAVALVAGVAIFPVVFSFGLEPSAGTALAFETLPTAFAAMPGGRFVAVAFFSLLFLAAVTSAVSLLEVGVSTATGNTRLSRRAATAALSVGMVVLGLPSALSYSAVDLRLGGVPVLDALDGSVGTFALPFTALLTVLAFVWLTEPAIVRERLGGGSIVPLLRYAVPIVLGATTTYRLVTAGRGGFGRVPDAIHPDAGVASLLVLGIVCLALVGWYWTREQQSSRAARRGRTERD